MSVPAGTAPEPYADRPKCRVCSKPAGPFGNCGFDDFCACDQRVESTFPAVSAAPEYKLRCGCFASRADGGGSRIEGEGFLCDRGHKQGDVIPDQLADIKASFADVKPPASAAPEGRSPDGPEGLRDDGWIA